MPAALTRFEFPAPLPCSPDMLGVRLPVRNGDERAELCLPIEQAAPRTHGQSLRPPVLQGGPWLRRVLRHVNDDEDPDWGRYYRSGPTYPDDWRVSIRAAVLRVPASDVTDDGLDQIGASVTTWIFEWYLRLRDWLEALTGVDLGHEHITPAVTHPTVVESQVWVANTKITNESGWRTPTRISMSLNMSEEQVTRDDWTRAVREANSGNLPPYQQLLLRDAKAALNRQMWRRAVVDAATAVEATLAPVLVTELDELVGDAARRVLVPPRTPISRRTEILKALEVPLPYGLTSDLFQVRNRVVHGGAPPSADEARAAVRAAQEVMALHSPL